jgi:hypothetical protein
MISCVTSHHLLLLDLLQNSIHHFSQTEMDYFVLDFQGINIRRTTTPLSCHTAH